MAWNIEAAGGIGIRKEHSMSYVIAHRFPDEMIFEKGGPFVSLYQPTHRHSPQQDPIVFRNLLRRIEHSLKQQTDRDSVELIMEPLNKLEKDQDFWNTASDGIAVLAARDKCIVYSLHGPVNEIAVVSHGFHIKPLLQAFQSVESYHLLGLSRTRCNMYLGNRYGFSKIVTGPDFPGAMEDVVGEQSAEPYSAQGYFGGTSEPGMHHGQGDKKEGDDKDTEKYFRYVDRFVFENYSKLSKLPLILVALKEYHSLFGGISHNPYLLQEGVNISYDSLEMGEFIGKALEIIEPINAVKILKLKESYESAEAESYGSSDLAQIVKAACDRRVETLFMEENRTIPGEIDCHTGAIKHCDASAPDCDDILDDLAELVLKSGGAVWVFPREKMPGHTGIAAIYRYK